MQDIVIYGPGELGRLLAGGAARAGFRVTPIIRGADPAHVLTSVPPGTPILICVGEADLGPAVAALPSARQPDVVLLQNELFPDVWQRLGLAHPTVLVPWILQKKGLPTRVVQATPIAGHHADTILAIHQALAMPCRRLNDEHELEDALAAKWSFILVVNALGAIENRTMGAWLEAAPDAITKLIRDAVAIATDRLGRAPAERTALEAIIAPQVTAGMAALADTPAAGRTAATRVHNAREWARARGLETPALDRAAAGQVP